MVVLGGLEGGFMIPREGRLADLAERGSTWPRRGDADRGSGSRVPTITTQAPEYALLKRVGLSVVVMQIYRRRYHLSDGGVPEPAPAVGGPSRCNGRRPAAPGRTHAGAGETRAMTEHEASRTLVKSPPELWAECSEAASLARHLGEFGEIRITKLEPETAVAWEGDVARGTVRLEPSGWGTRVILTAAVEAVADAESRSPLRSRSRLPNRSCCRARYGAGD